MFGDKAFIFLFYNIIRIKGSKEVKQSKSIPRPVLSIPKRENSIGSLMNK